MSPESAAVLLAELTAHGITLRVEGDYLRCRPRSAVTRDLVERITARKAELLAILRATDTTDTDRTPAAGSESGVVEKTAALLLYSQAERDLLAGVTNDTWRTVDQIKLVFPGARVTDVSKSPVVRPQAPPSTSAIPCMPGWSPAAWAKELHRKAKCCEEFRPDISATYRAWAEDIERRLWSRDSRRLRG